MRIIDFFKTANPVDPATYLLLHMDGENNGTAFPDSSQYAQTVSRNGGVIVSTAQSKFGGASAYYDGTGDFQAITGINFGTGAFCIELWAYCTGIDRRNFLISYGGSAEANGAGFGVYAGHSDGANNYLMLYASAQKIVSTKLPINEWHHIAIVGNGGANGARNVKMYDNGTQVGSTYTVDYNYTGKTLQIGCNEDNTADCQLGYIDDVRVSIGVQRYTGNFTPSAYPHAA